ncbi:MAG: ferredoxin reductase [Dehalococcoidia bacterium]
MTSPESRPTRTALGWQLATVRRVKLENHRAKTFTFTLPHWRPFKPGQHFDVRLTAPDGYQAQRSYSIASPPETEGEIDLTIEMLEDGEVSPFFHSEVQEGDEIELRGPIGGPFTWTVRTGGPVLLAAGGSGIVPLMSMLRHRQASGAIDINMLLLYSARSLEDVIYRQELDQMAADPNLIVRYTLTRSRPEGWTGYGRRIDQPMLEEALADLGEASLAYVCGPTPFVESVADTLVTTGMLPAQIRTERFGPTGTP